MEAKHSTNAVQQAVQVQTGCQNGYAGHGLFSFTRRFRENMVRTESRENVFWKPERASPTTTDASSLRSCAAGNYESADRRRERAEREGSYRNGVM